MAKRTAKKKGAGRARAKSAASNRRAPQPKDVILGGMEDSIIAEIENAAGEYVDVRDERMALTEQEVPLKEKLLKVMHKHGKTTYVRGNIDVRVVPEGETVKVRIKKASKDAEVK